MQVPEGNHQRSKLPLVPFVQFFISGSIALSTAFAIVHPLDTLKTLMQTSQPIQLKLLTRGFFTSILGAAPQGGLRLATYELTKLQLKSQFDNGNPIIISACSAICGDFVSSIVKVPREVITARLQTENTKFNVIVRRIFTTEGISGFFKGFWSTSLRDWPFMIILFSSYESMNHYHGKDQQLSLTMSTMHGGVSGALAGFITTPMDMIKTRIMTTEKEGIVSAFKYIRQNQSFFTGALPRTIWWFSVCSIFFPVSYLTASLAKLQSPKQLNQPLMIDYDSFINKLSIAEAVPLTAALKEFLNEFKSCPRLVHTQKKKIAAFLNNIISSSSQNPAFKDMELDNIVEGWEKLLMSKIYDQVFQNPDEIKPNAHLLEKMKQYSWIEERHLDLPFSVSIPAAGQELQKLQDFRSPRDKLTLLFNFSQIAADLVKKQSQGNAGNDHLLPCLILLILQAKPLHFIANVKYISRFRNPEKLTGIYQFCLTNIMGAVSFIYNLTPKSLTLNEEEKIKYLSPQASVINHQIHVPELQQFAHNFTGFLGNIFKEVKSISNDAAENVQGFVQRLGSNQRYPAQSQPIPASSSQSTSKEDEEFELQLAMALSLSLQPNNGSMESSTLENESNLLPKPKDDALTDVDESSNSIPSEKITETEATNNSIILNEPHSSNGNAEILKDSIPHSDNK